MKFDIDIPREDKIRACACVGPWSCKVLACPIVWESMLKWMAKEENAERVHAMYSEDVNSGKWKIT